MPSMAATRARPRGCAPLAQASLAGLLVIVFLSLVLVRASRGPMLCSHQLPPSSPATVHSLACPTSGTPKLLRHLKNPSWNWRRFDCPGVCAGVEPELPTTRALVAWPTTSVPMTLRHLTIPLRTWRRIDCHCGVRAGLQLEYVLDPPTTISLACAWTTYVAMTLRHLTNPSRTWRRIDCQGDLRAGEELKPPAPTALPLQLGPYSWSPSVMMTLRHLPFVLLRIWRRFVHCFTFCVGPTRLQTLPLLGSA